MHVFLCNVSPDATAVTLQHSDQLLCLQVSQQGLTKEQEELVDALFTLASNRMLRKYNSLRSQGKVMDVQTFDTFMKLFKRCDS